MFDNSVKYFGANKVSRTGDLMTGSLTMTGSNQISFNNGANNRLYADSVNTLHADTAIFQIGKNEAANSVLRFLGSPYNGQIFWDYNDDYFKFMDDVLMNGAERIYFNNTSNHIVGGTGSLDVTSNNLSLVSNQVKLGKGDGDVTIIADGSGTSTGVVLWDYSEDHFDFKNSLFLSGTNALFLGDSNAVVTGDGAGNLELAGAGSTYINTPNAFFESNATIPAGSLIMDGNSFISSAGSVGVVISGITGFWPFMYDPSLNASLPSGTGMEFSLVDNAFNFNLGYVPITQMHVSHSSGASYPNGRYGTFTVGGSYMGDLSVLSAGGQYEAEGFFQAKDRSTAGVNTSIGLVAKNDTTRDASEAIAFAALSVGGYCFNALGTNLVTLGFFYGQVNNGGHIFNIQQASNTTAGVMKLRQDGTGDIIEWLDGTSTIGGVNDTGQIYFRDTAEDKVFFNGDGGGMKIAQTGSELEIHSPNDLSINCGSPYTVELQQPVWDDLFTPFDSAKVPAAAAPTWAGFTGSLNAYTFGVDDKLEMTTELLHGYKEGTWVELHVHWANNGAIEYDQNVRWEVGHSIINSGVGSAFPSPTYVSAVQSVPSGASSLTNQYLTVGSVDGSTTKVGAIIKAQVKRVAAGVGSELAEDPFGLILGVHYQVDTMGSREMIDK